jgi:hypothetical protein
MNHVIPLTIQGRIIWLWDAVNTRNKNELLSSVGRAGMNIHDFLTSSTKTSLGF